MIFTFVSIIVLWVMLVIFTFGQIIVLRAMPVVVGQGVDKGL